MAKVTIWKYQLTAAVDPQFIEMPVGAEILTAGGQHDRICLWAKVEPGALLKNKRTFLVVGTGWDFDDVNTRYIGTAIVCNGRFVWHVYEIVP